MIATHVSQRTYTGIKEIYIRICHIWFGWRSYTCGFRRIYLAIYGAVTIYCYTSGSCTS